MLMADDTTAAVSRDDHRVCYTAGTNLFICLSSSQTDTGSSRRSGTMEVEAMLRDMHSKRTYKKHIYKKHIKVHLTSNMLAQDYRCVHVKA